MCVASAQSTVPCTNDIQTNCVKSTIPCVNGTDCKQQEMAANSTVSIPCISTAKIYADITFVNNTIVVDNAVANNGTTNGTTSITTTTAPKVPQNLCVTIVALPATRQPTEGEQVFQQAKSVFSKFVVKALGIS